MDVKTLMKRLVRPEVWKCSELLLNAETFVIVRSVTAELVENVMQ
jgi:hypothetical protein